MFGEQQADWFAPGNLESNFAIPHSQGQLADTRIVYNQYQYSSATNPPCYPQDLIAPSLGRFGMFQSIDYSQEQERNFLRNKPASEPAVEPISVSPKSLSFCSPQMTGPLGPTAGLGLQTRQLVPPEAGKSSFSGMGYGSTTPFIRYESNQDGDLGYETGITYQMNNENVGHKKEENNYSFNLGFQSNLGGSISTENPPISLESSQLDQHSVFGPDITNLLDSFFNESGSMPIDSTRNDFFPGVKPPTLDSVQQFGLCSPTEHQIDEKSHQRLDRDQQTGVLKPLQNITHPALGGSSTRCEQEIKSIYKQLPKHFPGGMPEILELPRIARNLPKNPSQNLGADQLQKRKFSDEEGDQSFISCRTIKTTRRVITGGKNSQGSTTYCPLITVSIPSVPWIPEINCGSKTNSKNANPRRIKAASTLRKKVKVGKS